jgi:uncharacterized protein YjbJ (UPF0337 family)
VTTATDSSCCFCGFAQSIGFSLSCWPTDDVGHQIKGKAKQVQASAMKAAADLKEGAKVAKKRISNAADQVADDLS